MGFANATSAPNLGNNRQGQASKLASSDYDIARDVIRRYDSAEKMRGNWERLWEDIARRIMPAYSYTFQSREYMVSNGQRKTEEMVDATGALALPKFAAAMESMLTPRGQTWHTLQPVDATLKRNRQASMWYDDANQALFRHRYGAHGNFASQMHESYMSLGAFGTTAMFIDKLDYLGQKGLRYRNLHLGEVYFLENHQGSIDTVIRKFPLTARQAYQKYGESLPDEIKLLRDDPAKQDVTFWFIHMVRPRAEVETDYDPRRLDVKGMKFGSYHVSVTGAKLVHNGGYNTLPFCVSRYVVGPGELYGRSPAMMCLPALKTLNEEKKTVLKQGHRAVDPVLLAHDDGIIDGFSLTPGDINYGGVTENGQVLVHALPTGNLQFAKELMEEERNVINDAFLVTLFQILVDQPQMTATEVLERAREKGALLSPSMGRQQTEFLEPMIERELDLLAQQGLLPPMPDIVKQARAEYQAVYDSPLSRSQRAEQGTGLMNYINWAKDLIAVTQDPSMLDWIDFDSASPELAQLQGTPNRWIRGQDGVTAIRAQRAKAQQTQQALDAAPAMAGVAKALPSLKLGGQIGGSQ